MKTIRLTRLALSEEAALDRRYRLTVNIERLTAWETCEARASASSILLDGYWYVVRESPEEIEEKIRGFALG